MTAHVKNTVLQNRYQIVRLVGKSEMGAVYQAFDQHLRIPVALKQLLNYDPHYGADFASEVSVLADLKHESLPRILDHFEDGNQLYLVMEFFPGIDLASQLDYQGQPFPISDVINWGKLLLDVLEYLHSHNPPVIHRDVKPQNLKITDKGKLILLDFGLAKPVLTTSEPNEVAHPSHYAALEQLQGGTVDERSDLYGVGATLYHLATGRKPIDALTRAEALRNSQPDPLVASSTLNKQIPADLDGLISQALAISADERPASAALMRQALAISGDKRPTNTKLKRQTSTLSVSAPAVTSPSIAIEAAPLKQTTSVNTVQPKTLPANIAVQSEELPADIAVQPEELPANIFGIFMIFAIVAFCVGVLLAVLLS